MTRARQDTVPPDSPGFYHCISRCVRRAYLCGFDASAQRSFNHRRRWIEQRIEHLSEVFCVDIYAYAIMSNHYHVVLRVDPVRATTLTDQEVADRWNKVYAWASSEAGDNPRQISPDRIPILRTRLGSLSWFMKALNEPIARIANAEDDCKGHFWESRFKSLPLLDERAVLACMTYVEMNPVRSGEVRRIDRAKFSSMQIRLTMSNRKRKAAVGPVFGNSNSQVTLSISTNSFLNLLRWSTEQHKLKEVRRARGPTILQRNGINTRDWVLVVTQFLALFRTAAGDRDACVEFYSAHDRQRILDRRGRGLLYGSYSGR